MGTEGWQGQSDLESLNRQALKASDKVLPFHSSEMHEKSSLISWNNITLWRHSPLFFYPPKLSLPKCCLQTQHKFNGSASVHLWREFWFPEMMPQTCQGQERPHLTEGEICASRFGRPPTQSWRCWTMKGGWGPVKALGSRDPSHLYLHITSSRPYPDVRGQGGNTTTGLKATKRPLRILKTWIFFLFQGSTHVKS